MKTWTAQAPGGTLLAGTYALHVVDYSSATDELGTAIEEAAKTYRAKGMVKYEGVNMLDNHRSWRQTVETANERILTEILVARNNRLYMSESRTGISAPVPALFQASLQILNENGARIRYRSPSWRRAPGLMKSSRSLRSRWRCGRLSSRG